MKDNPRALTKEGVLKLSCPSFDQELTLQILQLGPPQPAYYQCFLSDGAILARARLVETAFEDVQRGLVQANNVVILGRNSWSKAGPGLFQVSNWSLLSRTKAPLGNPVVLGQYTKMVHTGRLIPRQVAVPQEEVQEIRQVRKDCSIKELLFFDNKMQGLVLKAKVVHKSQLMIKNCRMFFATLMDGEDELECVFFNEEAERFHPVLFVGREYRISHLEVRRKKHREEKELKATPASTVFPVSTPVKESELVELQELSDLERGKLFSFFAVVAKREKKGAREECLLITSKGRKVDLTLWPEFAEAHKLVPRTVLLFRNFRVGCYNDCYSLNSTKNSTIESDHRAGFPPLQLFKPSFSASGKKRHGTPRTVSAIKQVTAKEVALVQGFLMLQPQSLKQLFYIRCKCNLRHMPKDEPCYQCHTTVPAMQVRLNLKAQVIDHTDSVLCYMAESCCSLLFGKQLHEALLEYAQDEQALEQRVQQLNGCDFQFAVKVNPRDSKVYYNIIDFGERVYE